VPETIFGTRAFWHVKEDIASFAASWYIIGATNRADVGGAHRSW
jgi:hypothetical protein